MIHLSNEQQKAYQDIHDEVIREQEEEITRYMEYAKSIEENES